MHDVSSGADDSSPRPSHGVFASLLGASFARLNAQVREVHDGRSRRLQGVATVTRGSSLAARAICRLASLPPAQTDGSVRVALEVTTNGEVWTRWFGNSAPMRSSLRAADGLLVERLGPLRLRFRLAEAGGDLDWLLESVSFLGIPAPRSWLRHTTARCTQRDGRYAFEVNAALPLVGHLVGYRGCVDASDVDSACATVVFDGDCVLCSAWTRFLIRRDRFRRLRFATAQSEYGRRMMQAHGIDPGDPASFLLVVTQGSGTNAHVASAGVLRTLAQLGGAWRLMGALRVVPRFVRDAAYRLLARHRYAWFGRRSECYVPGAAERERFPG